jgi:2-C-methyl-D-erythritol 4-phosphate cytidylyltransferase
VDPVQTPGCLAVVPVDADDRTAPLRCGALRELRHRPLLLWAVSALQSSGLAHEVVVAVPPALEETVARILPVSEIPVQVLPVQADGPGHRLLAALHARPGDTEVVVVHDPLHPLSPAALVRDVVRDLLADPRRAASIPPHAVTDTLKWVDEDEVVLGTADRVAYRMVYSPQAYRREALHDALSKADDRALRAHGCEVLPHLVQACGGAVSLVPSGGEALRVAGEEDILLAEALLDMAGKPA